MFTTCRSSFAWSNGKKVLSCSCNAKKALRDSSIADGVNSELLEVVLLAVPVIADGVNSELLVLLAVPVISLQCKQPPDGEDVEDGLPESSEIGLPSEDS